MKKILSLLFSIAFLLVFVSFFSQKSLAVCGSPNTCQYSSETCPSGYTTATSQCDCSLKIPYTGSAPDHNCTNGDSCFNCIKSGSTNPYCPSGTYTSCPSGSSSTFASTVNTMSCYYCSPQQPTNLSVMSPSCVGTDSQMSFTWTGVAGASYYWIRFGTSSAASTAYKTYANSYTATGLSYASSIVWWVQACDASDRCSPSPQGSTTTAKDCTPPPAPKTCAQLAADNGLTGTYSCVSSLVCTTYNSIKNPQNAASDCGQQGDPTHGTVCCKNLPTCSDKGGICVEKSRGDAAYGSQITDAAPCNPAGTTADPVLCYSPAPVIPVSTCNTNPTKPQTVLNNTCYNNCPGTCQADSSYCADYGGSAPVGDAYCGASTNNGHSFCCASTFSCTPDPTCKPTYGSCGAGTTTACSADGVKTNPACSIDCPPPPPTTCDLPKLNPHFACVNNTCTQVNTCDLNTDGCTKAGDSCNAAPGLALVLGLDGIGHTGDQANADWTTKTNTAIINGQAVTNPVAGSNQSPKNPTRPITLTLTDTTTNAVATLKGNVTFQTSGTNIGKYAGTVPYGANFKTGTYKIKITIDGHLTKLVPGSVTVVDTNTTVNVPGVVNLVTGDIATPNALSVLDYHILLSCISDPNYNDLDGHALCNQVPSYKINSDLEDNGAIDKFDYNLFLREFKMIQVGD